MGGELVGWKNTLVLLSNGERFQNYRRYARQVFENDTMMDSFLTIMESAIGRLLDRFHASPDRFPEHIRK